MFLKKLLQRQEGSRAETKTKPQINMEIKINLNKIEVKVTRTRGGSILGFAEVRFIGGGNVAFIIRGYTIKMKPWGLSVDAPAYKTKLAKTGWMTSFAVEPKEFWRKIKAEILKEYKSAPEPEGSEDIDPDEIPGHVGKREDIR